MKTQAHNKASCFDRAGAARGVVTLLIASIAMVLFSTFAIARIMGWGPNSTDDSGGILEPEQTAAVPTGNARAKPRCPDCGVIVSMREIQEHDEDPGPGAAGGVTAGNRDATRVKSTRSYELVVRMADGSRRVIHDAKPANWRTGEGLIVIGGVKPSSR